MALSIDQVHIRSGGQRFSSFPRCDSRSSTWAIHIQNDRQQEADAHWLDDQLQFLRAVLVKERQLWQHDQPSSRQLRHRLGVKRGTSRDSTRRSNWWLSKIVHRCTHWSRSHSLHGKTRCPDYREATQMWEEMHVCRDSIHRNNKPITEATVRTPFFTQLPPSVQAFFLNKDPILNEMQPNVGYSIQWNENQTF